MPRVCLSFGKKKEMKFDPYHIIATGCVRQAKNEKDCIDRVRIALEAQFSKGLVASVEARTRH